MATNDPSFAPLSLLTKETTLEDAIDISPGEILETADEVDDGYETTKKELWAYYWCVDPRSSHKVGCP